MAASNSFSPVSFYTNFAPRFFSYMSKKYASMRAEDIEDLFQESFMIVIDNFNNGKTIPDTNWWNYLIGVGSRQMSKKIRGGANTVSLDELLNGEAVCAADNRMDTVFDIISSDDGATPEDPIDIVMDYINLLPDNQRGIILDKVEGKLNDTIIARKWGYANSSVVKAKRSQIMRKMRKALNLAVA